jgi:hypothetical protein
MDGATATISIGRGADLPVDVTTANVVPERRHGISPVSTTTAHHRPDLASGTKQHAGFAGQRTYGASCRFGSRAVINGFIAVSDATMSIVLAHEIAT